MRFVEATGAAWTAEQLRAAEAELEAQKREWEANRLAAMEKEEQLLKQETEAEELLTYSRKDASNQVNTKQDSNLSKRTPGVGIRLTKHNKRDKRFKQHGVVRGPGSGLSRSISNKQRSTVQQVSPVRTRHNSLNVSAPAKSSGNSSSKRSTAVAITVPARRQTRLHSVAVVNAAVTPTPPTRKTTRTALAAAGGATVTTEERPKRQSANIAMSKMMKTPVKAAAPTATTTITSSSVKNNSKPRRRESVSLTTTAASRRKLLERRATISAPLALKQAKSNSSDVSGDEEEKDEEDVDDEDDEDVDGEEDEDAENAFVSVDSGDDDNQDEDTRVSGSASDSNSPQEDTTQTEDDEEMHVERLDEDDDTNDDEDNDDDVNANVDSDADVNVDTQSNSSYATAGEDGNSLDGWNAHNQVQDTTMTSSTYYNVSEESDTDDPNDPLSLAKAEAKTESKESTPSLQRQRSNSSRVGSDDAIGHTPRTRSRGSVKINLWTLDVSPVLSTQKGSSASRNVRRSTPRNESTLPDSKAKTKTRPRPLSGNSRLLKKADESQTTTLNRWITKTPRVCLRSTSVVSGGTPNSVNTSASTVAITPSGANSNGASSNR